jgi:uncharacterized protein YjdB
MKKQIIIVLLAITAIYGCKKDQDLTVKGISLSKTSLTLKPADTATLFSIILPANATNKAVTWSTSDSTIAKVVNGLVTAIKPGSAIISAKSVENFETATCSVTVSNNDPITAVGNVEGVWKKYSTVNVTGHIFVPAGKTLKIEEGVEILINNLNDWGKSPLWTPELIEKETADWFRFLQK